MTNGVTQSVTHTPLKPQVLPPVVQIPQPSSVLPTNPLLSGTIIPPVVTQTNPLLAAPLANDVIAAEDIPL